MRYILGGGKLLFHVVPLEDRLLDTDMNRPWISLQATQLLAEKLTAKSQVHSRVIRSMKLIRKLLVELAMGKPEPA